MSSKARATEGSASEPPTKRQKISLACEECRKQKIKCNGARPICASCVRRNQACTYRGEKPPERGHACTECKSRKVKCDGSRPICDNCEKRGLDVGHCIYSDGLEGNATAKQVQQEKSNNESSESSTDSLPARGHNVQDQQSYIQMLESRVQELENSRQPLQAQSNPNLDSQRSQVPVLVSAPRSTAFDPPSGVLVPESNSPVLYNYEISQHILSPPQQRTGTIAVPPPEPRRDSSPEEADAMGAVEDTSPGAAGGFFGSSSAMSFVKQIRRAIQEKGSTNFPSSSSTRSMESPRSIQTPSHKRTGSWGSPSILRDQLLPQRKVADDLVDSYFFYVHPLYPFLHTPNFLENYNKLWVNVDGRAPDPLFHCTLNLVFALGCHFCPNVPITERDSTAEVFFKPASKNLVNFENLHSASVPLVQALLLMSQYLQATNLPNQCWIVVGIATRLAQSLGLHLRSSTTGLNLSPVEVEMRRRTWHGCILLDRAMCMIFGRPSCISHVGTCPIPLAIDDDKLDTQTEANPSKPSLTSFFVHTLGLYEVLFEVLNTFYGSSTEDIIGTNPSDAIPRLADFNAVLQLDEQLETWEENLPGHLKFPPVIPVSDKNLYNKMYRQSVCLQCRYLHIRILLYRPLLIQFFASSLPGSDDAPSHNRNTKLQQSMMFRCSLLCARAAQRLVSTIEQNVDSGSIPAWWYSAFYTYTAGTVLLTARTCPPLRDELGSSLENIWDDALKLLQRFGTVSKSSKRCFWILKRLESGIQGAETNVDTMDHAHHQLSNVDQTQVVFPPENGPVAEEPSQLDWAFDPGDLAWLTNVPFDSLLEGFQEF